MISSDKGSRIPDRRCATCGHWCSSHALPGDSDYRRTTANCFHADAMTGVCQCREFTPDSGEAA